MEYRTNRKRNSNTYRTMNQIHIHHYSIRNGKSYEQIAIDETINESQLPELTAKYRKLIGSVESEDFRGRKVFTPDIYFSWGEITDGNKNSN